MATLNLRRAGVALTAPIPLFEGSRRVTKDVFALTGGGRMEMPLDLDTMLSELSEEESAWTLRDGKSGLYVTIPHERYPGLEVYHFVESYEDAKKVLDWLFAENPAFFRARFIYPCEVKLKASLRLLLGTDPLSGFAVHRRNEVFEFLDRKLSKRSL